MHETNNLEKMKTDDVVLIINSVKPKPYWQLGEVVELLHGEDNRVSSVDVKKGDALVEKKSQVRRSLTIPSISFCSIHIYTGYIPTQ